MLVSVIIPAYNASRFIRETLHSALSQTYKEIEIVVVDDGSTDDTAEIVTRFSEADGRVRLLSQQNQGASAARNHGISASTGEFIAFLDADDLWHPTKLEKQVKLLQESPADVGLIYTWCRMIDNEGAITGFSGTYATRRGTVFDYLLVDNFVANGSIALVRRCSLPGPPPFDTELSGNEDYYFYLRIARSWKVDYVPEFLVGYRWNTGQNKSANFTRLSSSRKQMIDKLLAAGPISRRALAWSNSSFDLGLAQLCFKRGDRRASMDYLRSAMSRGPSFVFAPTFRRSSGIVVRWVGRKMSAPQSVLHKFMEADTRPRRLQ